MQLFSGMKAVALITTAQYNRKSFQSQSFHNLKADALISSRHNRYCLLRPPPARPESHNRISDDENDLQLFTIVTWTGVEMNAWNQ